jgi:hypothetical protein
LVTKNHARRLRFIPIKTAREFPLRDPENLTIPQRDIDKLQVTVDGRQAAIDAASAARQSTETQVSTLSGAGTGPGGI